MTSTPNQLQLSEDQLDVVKQQLASMVERMSRAQIFDIADYLYAEARLRRQTPERFRIYEVVI